MSIGGLQGRKRLRLVPFPDVPTAIGAVPRIVAQGRMLPAAVEFMDRLSA